MSDTLSTSRTWAHQSQLPNLPIPSLEDTCRRYLTALKGLQDEKDHENTKRAVQAFLNGDGPRVQQSLIEYAKNKPRCVFAPHPLHRTRCSHIIVTSRTFGTSGNNLLRRPQRSHLCRYESYLQHSDSVVLALNPFFVLECVRTLFLSTSFTYLPQGMTPHLRVAHNSREQRPSSSPR